MEPCNFKQANLNLGPPKGVSEDDVRTLRVYRGTIKGEESAMHVISCWKPTKEELEEITRTGRVWLFIAGSSMPPAGISGLSPWDEEE